MSKNICIIILINNSIMSRRLLITFVALVGIAMQGNAQFIKYVRVKTDDVNLRKSPSTNSPKLMEAWSEGEHYFAWSGTSDARGMSACHPHQDEVLGVNDICGDWLKILKNGKKCDSGECTMEYAYIMAKFCEEVHPIPTTAAMYNEYKNEFRVDNVLGYRSSGKYKGKFIAKFDRCGEADSYGGLRLGKCTDGKLVFEQGIVLDIIPDFTQTKLYVNPRAKYDMHAKELNYGTPYKDGHDFLDLSKLTDADVDLIFGSVITQKPKYTSIVFYTEEGLWAEIYW